MQEERGCCHKCGSCFTHLTWCGIIAYMIPLFTMCSFLMIVATLMTDFGSLALYLPRNPTVAFPDACAALQLSVGENATLGVCTVLSGCFDTPSVDLYTALAVPLGLSNGGMDMSSVDTSMISASPINATTVSTMLADANSANVPTALDADSLGVPANHALYAPINDHLANLRTSIAGIAPPLAPLPAQVDALVIAVNGAIASVTSLVAAANGFLNNAPTTFACDWMPASWYAHALPSP